MSDNIPFTKLDFDEIRLNLKTYLSAQEQFKDYDFDGSNMSVLLDILAYNTFQNNYYSNMVFSEMFLDSAQLRDSVVSHAKELNYLPRSMHSAQSTVSLRINAADSPVSITVPRGTKFKAVCGTEVFTFVTSDSYSVYPNNGSYTISGVDVYEGKIIKEYYTVTGDERQEFIINNKNVDTNSVRVRIRDNVDVDSSKSEYQVKGNIYGVLETDEVFYIEPASAERYKVTFGRNAFGYQPVVGNVVEIEYRVTRGIEANGATNIQIIDQPDGYDAIVTFSQKAEGGQDVESTDSIKFFAPKSIQVQDRAVNSKDYEILLKNRFSEISAVSVYGGEELDPPRFGKVAISADVQSGYALTSSAISRYIEYLNDISPLAIEPIFVKPQYMYANVDTTVYYNTNTTTSSATDIKNDVLGSIANFSITELSDFNKTMRYSHLTRYIDDSNSSIVSNDTTVKAVIAISPITGLLFSEEIKFNNSLILDHPLTLGEDIRNHDPAIASSNIVYRGETGYIVDGGNGNLHIIQTNGSDFTFLKQNIGTVDYQTGRVVINNLLIDSYTGTDLRFYAKLRGKDIAAPKDRIIKIRPSDVTVRVSGVRE